ncbi:class III lanthionine synthetase LanKC [Streptomyces sp. NPDC056254]|uniref:class III lanthionine synthetase LanKC n=1 Tax=Streptomyces sp. NPDC056254 TaxID=3345763 RepID=UPI0035E0211D
MTSTRPQPEEYCQASRVFYDIAGRHNEDDTSWFAQTGAPAHEGFERREMDVWIVHTPVGHTMPQQGWKIHISGLPDNARRIVDAAWDYCTREGLPFKFLRSVDVLTTHSLKYAPRSSSGKLVTIYPSDEQQLRRALEDLGALLDGEAGPYILTDLRWNAGPLHVRYGGFVARWCTDEDGSPVAAIERPDGTLVPDRRRPVFQVPEWVQLPAFLAEQLAAREAGGSAADFPYRVERALHFSNGGGVYLAKDAQGRQVVLKEGRPHAGLDGRGRDAVTRLARERRAMEHLAGIPGIPALYEHRVVWEHHFLAVQHLEGDTLQGWMARHYPLTKAGPADGELTAYARRAQAVADRIDRLVARVHARGMVFGDLHPANILIDDEDQVSLVDFELAVPVEEADRLGLGHPGFAGAGRTGYDIDRHALAALRLWLLFPLTGLSELDPGRGVRQADIAERRFALPAGTLDAVRRELAPGEQALERVPAVLREAPGVDLDHERPDWTAVRKSLAEAVLLSATPERDDRLFPGDVRQFLTDGLGLAHGAAGVLWALHTSGAGRYPEHEEWLLKAADRRPPSRPGLYDGAHGVAHVLREFGHLDAAEALLARSAQAVGALRDPSLQRGTAGIGLDLLDAAARTGDGDHRRRALALADRMADAIALGTAPGITAGPGRGSRAGLLRGWSGPALFFLRLYEDTADAAHLDLAVRALHHDLDLCGVAEDGSLQADGGFRLLPYLEVGSAGIALVADQVLAHRGDARLEQSLPLLVRAAEPEFTIEPHLFGGRAGLLATLASLRTRTAGPAPATAVPRHLSRLHWHALSYRGHVAFPGEQLRRISMDLATGSPGILLALTAALDGRRDFLPFLAPRTDRPTGVDPHAP